MPESLAHLLEHHTKMGRRRGLSSKGSGVCRMGWYGRRLGKEEGTLEMEDKANLGEGGCYASGGRGSTDGVTEHPVHWSVALRRAAGSTESCTRRDPVEEEKNFDSRRACRWPKLGCGAGVVPRVGAKPEAACGVLMRRAERRESTKQTARRVVQRTRRSREDKDDVEYSAVCSMPHRRRRTRRR